VALHRERPVTQVRDDEGRDPAVVLDDVRLRDPALRPPDLAEPRQADRPPPALDQLLVPGNADEVPRAGVWNPGAAGMEAP